MAPPPGEDSNLTEAVVTCEGNLHDPDFSQRFNILLGNLKTLLREDEKVQVKKLEPWNSVRVTISIPKEAAQRLKLLAQQGSHALKALGILTVQVEGDQVISLTLAGQNQPTELILRQDGPSTSSSSHHQHPISSAPNISSSPSTSAFVRSPNVVAPAGEGIPVLPPKASPHPGLHRAPSLDGPFSFASMAHAAQTTMQTRTEHPNNNKNNAPSSNSTATSSANNTNANTTQLSNNNNVNVNLNNHRVNSTNLSSVPSSFPSSSTAIVPNSEGGVKGETLKNRLVLNSQVSHQSLQLQIVNAPPPYPGVNNGSSNNFSDSVNHQFHHQPQQQQQQQQQHQHQQLNSANLQTVTDNIQQQSVTFVGASPYPNASSSSSSSTGVTHHLVRSVSTPVTSSSSQPILITDSTILGPQQPQQQQQQQQQQQEMASPLLVNLLQNSEAIALQQGGQGGGFVNIMLPPGSSAASLEQKKLVLQQHLQQRKAKRGLSLDGACLTPADGTNKELSRPSSAGGIGDRSSPAPNNSSLDAANNTLTHITLPSSSPSTSSISSSVEHRIGSISSSVPISVGQPRPSSDLSTTATIIQGRTIIHQGNVRVFNPGQIRAIRLANSSNNSTFQIIQGKPVMTTTAMTTGGHHGMQMESSGAVLLNGPPQNYPHSSQTPTPPPAVFISTTTVTTTSNTNSNNNNTNTMGAEPNVVYSADQSSRTYVENITNTNIGTNSSLNINDLGNFSVGNNNNSNKISIPSSSSSSSSSSTSSQLLTSTTNHQRLSTPHSKSQAVQLQSKEAKLFPSQHLQQQQHRPTKPSHPVVSSGKPRQLLINPLTGHLEPMPSESDSDSDEDESKKKPRATKGIHPHHHHHPHHNKVVGGSIQHRQIVTTTTGVTVARVLKSEQQQKAMEDRKHLLQQHQHQNRLTVVPVAIGQQSPSTINAPQISRKSSRDEGIVTITPPKESTGGEKIKLRLKLEKSEPISPAYKVDVSYVKKSEKGAITTLPPSSSSSSTLSLGATGAANNPSGSMNNSEPRVPPLHISLRGKNAAVVVSSPRREEDNNSSCSPIHYPSTISTSAAESKIIGPLKAIKRTKNRVKSSSESEGPTANKIAKNPSKISRPRHSKDSSSSFADFEALVQETMEAVKARLEPPKTESPSPLSSSSISAQELLNTKDLTSSTPSVVGGSRNEPAATMISIPSPTVKLKSETPPPPQILHQNSSLNALLDSKPSVDQHTPPNLLDSSSLLFQHLSSSKKEDILSLPVALAVTVAQTTTATMTPPTQQVQASTSTSVLTLTSTETGASISSSLSQGISANDVASIHSGSSKTITGRSSPAINTGESGTVVLKSKSPTVQQQTSIDIPKLKRANTPKPLEISEVKIPELKKSSSTQSTPTSKSPKPLPDLLALTNLPSSSASTSPENNKNNSNIPPSLTPLETPVTEFSLPLLEQQQPEQPKLISPSDKKAIILESEKQPESKTSQILAAQVETLVGQSDLNKPGLIIEKNISTTTDPLPSKPKIPILRPKKQTPKVSIGTSIDSELSSLTSSPSLRELLEKEKEAKILLKEEKTTEAPLQPPTTTLSDVVNDFPSCNANHQKEEETDTLVLPPEAVKCSEEIIIPVKETVVDNVGENEYLKTEEKILVKVSSDIEIVPINVNLKEPVPSSAVPNIVPLPVPTPLVLPQQDDHPGVPGEDSGIDSMDALSEKSPNQGESPARKELIEPFTSEGHHQHHVSNVSSAVGQVPVSPKSSSIAVEPEEEKSSETLESKQIQQTDVITENKEPSRSVNVIPLQSAIPAVSTIVSEEGNENKSGEKLSEQAALVEDFKILPSNLSELEENKEEIEQMSTASSDRKDEQVSLKTEIGQPEQEIEKKEEETPKISSPTDILNHVDAVQQPTQNSKFSNPKPIITVKNANVRKAKLENIVAAIGTKNIERQQAKHEIIPLLSTTVSQLPTPEKADLSAKVDKVEEKKIEPETIISPSVAKNDEFFPASIEHQTDTIKRYDDDDSSSSLTKPLVQNNLEQEKTTTKPLIFATKTTPPTLIPEDQLGRDVKKGDSPKSETSILPPLILNAVKEDNVGPPKLMVTTTEPKRKKIETTLDEKRELPKLVTNYSPQPPEIPLVRATSPQKPILEPQNQAPKLAQRPKLSRRLQDKPPKLSKATETDPRPESANPPRLEMGALLQVKDQPKISPVSNSLYSQSQQNQNHAPQVQLQVQPKVKVPISTTATTSSLTQKQMLTFPNMLQFSKAMQIPGNVTTMSQAISPVGSSTISLPLQPSNSPSTTATLGGCQTVFTIHPNANLSQLQTAHGQSAITVLPSGQKIVPVKLVTIPRQPSGQFQTIPISQHRASPNILEAVNIVANAGSRSNSPKTNFGNQTTPININSINAISSGGGNIQLVPISMASTISGNSNPVKVLVSQPVKLQHQSHPQMLVKSVQMMGGTPTTTIRVLRPDGTHNNISVVTSKPGNVATIANHTETTPTSLPIPSTATKTVALTNNPTIKTTPTVQITTKISSVEKTKPVIIISEQQQQQQPQEIIVNKPPVKQPPIYKHVEDLEVLDSGLNQIDDFPFEADIIHDEKDLEDVLAGEEIEVHENGIGSPYDFTLEDNKVTTKYQGTTISSRKLATGESEANSTPNSPIPVTRSCSPLYTYGNRTSSSRTSQSPSPSESDVHGEDQEIIDSFTRSPSQPKLSPQNKPPPENAVDGEEDDDSPPKPDLIGEDKDMNQELSIEIPTSEEIVGEERKHTRSTRSNTRLVSPDITAFRSDTPKPTKLSTKPDPLNLRSSPKPSPTGSLKLLSPTVSSGLTITPSSSNRSSPILGFTTTTSASTITVNSNHINSIASGAIEKIGSNLIKQGSNNRPSKRKRQESDSSSASKDENSEEKTELDLNSRPGKRRCSENAAELIKACIGIEDTPKRNTMLIKRMEESKLKEAKLKKAMAPLVEENEDDNESVDSILNRGRGRSSRASSEDRSSSRGSSVHRSFGPSSKTVVDEKDQKATKTVRTGKEKNLTSNRTKIGDTISSAAKRVIRNSKVTGKDKSPLTPAKTRTNVKKDVGTNSGVAVVASANPSSAASEAENLRRKTRSTAGKRYVETSEGDLAAMKRRRISKDNKS